MMPHVATDSALGVRWDLTRVFADSDAARRALADLDAAAAALQPPGDDVAEIRAALDAHDDVVRVAEALHDEWGYAALRLSADVDDVEARDLLTASVPVLERVRAACRALEQRYGELPDETVDDPALAPYRHYLRRRRLERRYVLDPLAEEAFAARGDAANSAWRRLYDDAMTAVSVPFDAGDGVEEHTLEALGALLFRPDRDVRLRSVAAAGEPARDRGHGRGVPRRGGRRPAGRGPPARARRSDGRHAVHRPGVPRRRRGAADGDRGSGSDRAPLLRAEGRRARASGGERGRPRCPVGTPREIAWSEAVTIAHDVFATLGEEPGALARELSVAGLIDAEPRVGKTAGVYCAPLPKGFPSLIQMTFRGVPRDAFTLAHELGHAVHFELAKAAQPWLAVERSLSMAFVEIPSTTAEIASVERPSPPRRPTIAARCCAASSRACSTSCSRPRRCAGSSRTPRRCGPAACR